MTGVKATRQAGMDLILERLTGLALVVESWPVEPSAAVRVAVKPFAKAVGGRGNDELVHLALGPAQHDL
jgi:hypothetical protein